MYISETFVSFDDVGHFGLFVVLENHSAFMSVEDLVKQTKVFNNVFILGATQQNALELNTLINKTIKENMETKFHIITNGEHRFETPKYVDNVKFSLIIDPLQRDKLKEATISWFSRYNSRFIFIVNNEKDFDTLLVVISSYGIKKNNLFIRCMNHDLLEIIMKKAKIHGCNVSHPYRHWLYKNDGR